MFWLLRSRFSICFGVAVSSEAGMKSDGAWENFGRNGLSDYLLFEIFGVIILYEFEAVKRKSIQHIRYFAS